MPDAAWSGMLNMIVQQQAEFSQIWMAKVYADAGLTWEKPADRRSASDQAPAPPSDED